MLITEERQRDSSNSPFQVKVTMLSQVDLGDDTVNQQVYDGMLK